MACHKPAEICVLRGGTELLSVPLTQGAYVKKHGRGGGLSLAEWLEVASERQANRKTCSRSSCRLSVRSRTPCFERARTPPAPSWRVYYVHAREQRQIRGSLRPQCYVPTLQADAGVARQAWRPASCSLQRCSVSQHDVSTSIRFFHLFYSSNGV